MRNTLHIVEIATFSNHINVNRWRTKEESNDTRFPSKDLPSFHSLACCETGFNWIREIHNHIPIPQRHSKRLKRERWLRRKIIRLVTGKLILAKYTRGQQSSACATAAEKAKKGNKGTSWILSPSCKGRHIRFSVHQTSSKRILPWRYFFFFPYIFLLTWEVNTFLHSCLLFALSTLTSSLGTFNVYERIIWTRRYTNRHKTLSSPLSCMCFAVE